MDLPCLPPVKEPKKPAQPLPAGACDTHFHLFGPASKFPFSPERSYTPADAPLEALLRLHATLGIARGVVVQANPHGTDCAALLDALKREPGRLRGTAIVENDISDAGLRRMADAGVRALRFHHMPHGKGFRSAGLEAFAAMAPRMADLGLHAQFMMDASALDDALPYLKHWKLPAMIDHMGNVDASKGVQQPGFQLLCRQLTKGRLWVKVSGAYRISKQYPDYEDARPFHEALVKANPDQVVWGSDWPHPRLEKDMPDDGHLLDLFNAWTPDAGLRRKILVENPARLYEFV
ncbi:MAG: 2-pyrone-4,6-dicarboxylate hydrolase [Betaproteobacteria bacterium]|nr:2-pyrone-4,6-dicarboxylate hydrolase [Betaproteobacteria bacterium]